VIELRASCGPGEIRVAVRQDGALLDYAIDRPGAPDGIGDLHAGRVCAVMPAMAGVFVTLDGAEGFLPDSEGGAGLTEGAMVTVRVTRAAQGGKGPRLTARGSGAPCEAPVRLLRRGPGPLQRLAAAYPEAPVLFDEAVVFARHRAAFGGRAQLVGQAFDDALEADTGALADQVVALPSGMRASIVPTPALTAIDVDGAGATAGRDGKSASQLAANRAAIPALARQIRLRNLGGAIVLDFAGMPARKRAALGPLLEASLREDPAKPRLLGFTGLGFAEILRPRTAPPLHELLAGPLATGLTALRHAARNHAASASRLTLRAPPTVVSALQADKAALPDLARRLTHPIILISDPALPPHRWMIEES
jgi:hypothetical protein